MPLHRFLRFWNCLGKTLCWRGVEGLIFLLACSVHFVRRRFWAIPTESQRSRPNRRRIKCTEDVSQKIRPSKRLDLYIFQRKRIAEVHALLELAAVIGHTLVFKIITCNLYSGINFLKIWTAITITWFNHWPHWFSRVVTVFVENLLITTTSRNF